MNRLWRSRLTKAIDLSHAEFRRVLYRMQGVLGETVTNYQKECGVSRWQPGTGQQR